ncbi:hypothetical protein [Pseudoxanthomonas sp. LjRoot143]|uniref:hypothetical protein n=1 Tax=Pseudoxanthomonas sp. LjRoot143 TaxID=3342266 RepID=UPI003F4F858E
MMPDVFSIQAEVMREETRVGNFLHNGIVADASICSTSFSFIAVKSVFTFDVTLFDFLRASSHT